MKFNLLLTTAELQVIVNQTTYKLFNSLQKMINTGFRYIKVDSIALKYPRLKMVEP